MSAPPISAADAPERDRDAEPVAVRPPLPPCLLVDLLWESFAEAGAAALAGNAPADARAAWETAARLAAAFATADPRRAASVGSTAALNALAEPPPNEQEAALRKAVEAWRLAPLWVAAMRVERKPRSSLFHQRLERKHGAAYDETARRAYRRLAEGGLAASLGNLALLLRRLGRPAEAEAACREAVAARESALGARDPDLATLLLELAELRAAEARQLTARAAEIARNGPAEPLARWARDRPHRMSDLRRLLAAVYLARIIRSRHRA